MSLIEINRNLTRRQLLLAGVLLGLFVALVGFVVRWQSGSDTAAYAIWGVGAALVLVYFAWPKSRLPIYLGWIYAVLPIGWVVSHVLLGIVFYLVITPIGLIMRLFGRDTMRRRFEPSAASYWSARSMAPPASRYFRQY